MRIKWLGWAGVEIETSGAHVVIDPLKDAAAVFTRLVGPDVAVPTPEVTAPGPGAVAGLLTHLHRDHADAEALVGALESGAAVYEPVDYGGDGLERLALAQADRELRAAGLPRRALAAWQSVEAGPFAITALPAVDGTGDPQVSWLVEADGRRVLHLGDTMWHGWWWRIAERFGPPDVVLAPINGPRLMFPHRKPASPFPGAMDPEQASQAAELLRTELLIPIHYGAYDLPGIYEPTSDPLDRLASASVRAYPVAVGETLEV